METGPAPSPPPPSSLPPRSYTAYPTCNAVHFPFYRSVVRSVGRYCSSVPKERDQWLRVECSPLSRRATGCSARILCRVFSPNAVQWTPVIQTRLVGGVGTKDRLKRKPSAAGFLSSWHLRGTPLVFFLIVRCPVGFLKSCVLVFCELLAWLKIVVCL